MGIPIGKVRRIIREEIVLEAARRFRASLVPGEWDPDLGAAEEKAKIDNPNLDVSKKPGQVWKQLGKIAQSAGLAERVITIRESDVKDHFAGSTGSKYEMSAQGTYISHVPSMQEDEEDEDEDSCSESLKTRERMITIVR